MALSSFWKGVIVVGSALGVGAVLTLILGKKGLPPAPEGLVGPIDEENCSRRFFPSPNRGDSRGKDVTRPMPPSWIVLHDTESAEGADAANNASYFFNPEAKVSTHLVVDDSGACYRCVADDQIAWGAGVVNPRALQIEMVAPRGAALSWSPEDWLSKETLLETAAAHVSHWSSLYNIPTRFVDAAGLRNGDRGITTHAEVTKAFGGSHVDPGPNFPIDDFIRRVNSYTTVA